MSVDAFRKELQDLHQQARRPAYRRLQAHAELAGMTLRTSTISDLLNGPATPKWETVHAFVTACGEYARARRAEVPPERFDAGRWHERYQAMRDHAEDEAAERPRRRRVEVPAQLPAGVPVFVGRAGQLAALDQPAAIVVISGSGGQAGIGKTALALHWGHRNAGRFPDGQLYADLRGADPCDTLRGFLEALGVSPRMPAGLDARAALLRSLLAGRRMLIVLDNARDSDHVRHLLPGGPGPRALVTSRRPLTGLIASHGARPIRVGPLSTEESLELLRRRLGAERVRAEPQAARDLVAACDGLPLALAVAAARAVTRPRSSLAGLADGQLSDSVRHRTDSRRPRPKLSVPAGPARPDISSHYGEVNDERQSH